MNQVAHIPEAQDPALPADPMVGMIERIAMNPDLPMERLERMLDMRDRMENQAARAAHAASFAAASAEFPAIPLNGKSNNGSYATLKDIISHTRPALAKHGLALNFATETGKDSIKVTARLMHTSGHIETVAIELPRDTSGSKNAVQAVGSTQTYGQRYTAQAILGLSLGDDTEDDGRAAGGSQPISVAQFDTLRELIGDAGITEAVVCKAEKIAALQDLPANRFDAVAGKLRKTGKNAEAQQ